MDKTLSLLIRLAFVWLLLCALVAAFLLYGGSIKQTMNQLPTVKISGQFTTFVPFYVALTILFILASVIIWRLRRLYEKAQSSNRKLTSENERLMVAQRGLETQLELSKVTGEELNDKLSDYTKRIDSLSVESRELREANSELNSYIDSLKREHRQIQEEREQLQTEKEQLRVENELLKAQIGKKDERQSGGEDRKPATRQAGPKIKQPEVMQGPARDKPKKRTEKASGPEAENSTLRDMNVKLSTAIEEPKNNGHELQNGHHHELQNGHHLGTSTYG